MNNILHNLDLILEQRKNNPNTSDTSYISSLYTKGVDAILKKIAEEAGETIMASKDACYNQQKNKNLVSEVADLWFHCLILLHYHNLSSDDVMEELKHRQGISGITEKNQRNQRNHINQINDD